MYIQFSSKRLFDASVSLPEATRLLGAQIGLKYIQRLALLRAADKFTQLYGLKALRLHQLKGDRQGLHSITLTGNYRLIIERVQENIVQIIKVEDYHGN